MICAINWYVLYLVSITSGCLYEQLCECEHFELSGFKIHHHINNVIIIDIVYIFFFSKRVLVSTKTERKYSSFCGLLFAYLEELQYGCAIL